MLKKNVYVLVAIVICWISMFALNAQNFDNHAGTAEDPHEIANRADLEMLSDSVNAGIHFKGKFFVLKDDIDMLAQASNKADTLFRPIGNAKEHAFQGSFNGDGYTISNLYIQQNHNGVGFFGYVQEAHIKNLGIIAHEIKGNENVGGMIGCQMGGLLQNSYVMGRIYGAKNVGGLVGINDGVILNTYAFSHVFGVAENIGGLVGEHLGRLENSYAAGKVSADASVGGVIGNSHGTIVNCYYDNVKCDKACVCIGKSTKEMKSENFVNRLNGNGTAFKVAENNYPVLSWQCVDLVTLEKGCFDGFTLADGVTSAEYAPGMIDAVFIMLPEKSGLIRTWFGNVETIIDHASHRACFQMPNYGITLRADYSCAFSGGDGMKSSPFQISCRADLEALSDAVYAGNSYQGAYFKLVNNIDMGGKDKPSFRPIGYYENNDNYCDFEGHFNGDNHHISHLYIHLPNQNYVGLFGATTQGCIENLGLHNVFVTGDERVGGLIGHNYETLVSNCYVLGCVSGKGYVGGLVGYNYGSVLNSYAMGKISGEEDVGGFIGWNERSIITNCYAACTVSGHTNRGGLCGYDYVATITNCYYDKNKCAQSGVNGSDITCRAEGKTTTEMKSEKFANTLGGAYKGKANQYPILSWQNVQRILLPSEAHSNVEAQTSENPFSLNGMMKSLLFFL